VTEVWVLVLAEAPPHRRVPEGTGSDGRAGRGEAQPLEGLLVPAGARDAQPEQADNPARAGDRTRLTVRYSRCGSRPPE
jgi:hypothetical protein